MNGQIEDPRGLKTVSILINGIPINEQTSRGIGISARMLGIRIVATNLSGENSTYECPLLYKPSMARIFVATIGINRYKDPHIPSLNYAERDAKAFADYFAKKAGVPPSNIITLLGKEATQRNIKRLLGIEIKKRAQQKDQIVVFFAGHGAPEPEPLAHNVDGLEKYLLPYDSELEGLYATAIPMREVEYLIDRYASERVVLILDTCFSGQAGNFGRTASRKGLGIRAGMISSDFYARLAQGKGKMILTASAANQLSQELPKFKHGVFTHFLLRALEGRGDIDRDGVVTVNEAHQYVSKKVPQATGQAQVPQLFGGGGEVVLGRSTSPEIFMDIKKKQRRGGRLIMEVTPSDAEIIIDGKSRGNGPVLNTVLEEGTHRITVRRKSFDREDRKIFIARDSLTQLEIKLRRGRSIKLPPP
jgi:uncharacterized caspase-like protein